MKTTRTLWIFVAAISGVLLIWNIRDITFVGIDIVLLVIIALSLFYLFYDPIQKRLIKANEHLKQSRVKFAFYDDYFYEKCESPFAVTENSVSYEYIKTAYETVRHIYIYTLSGTCFIIKRGDIAPDDYFVLRTFLSSKIGLKFQTVK